MKKVLLLAFVAVLAIGFLTMPAANAQTRNVTFVLNTATIPDTAPSLFHRVRAQRVEFVTVFEPHRGPTRVQGVAAAPGCGVTVQLTDGPSLRVSLDELIPEATAK